MEAILKSMSVLFWAFFLSPLFISVVILGLTSQGESLSADPSSFQVLMLVSIGYVPVAIFMSKYLSQNQLKKIESNQPLAAKVEAYRTSWILGTAVLEGSIILLLIAYFLTKQMLLLPAIALVWAFQYLRKPTSEKITSDLALSGDEKRKVEEVLNA